MEWDQTLKFETLERSPLQGQGYASHREVFRQSEVSEPA
jgi:hypothetical protein